MDGITSLIDGAIFRVDARAADILGFDPARDKLDLGDDSARDFIEVDTAASDPGVESFRRRGARMREDRLRRQPDLGPIPDAQVAPQGMPVAGTGGRPPVGGAGAPPTGADGEIFEIKRLWGAAARIECHPGADKLGFGWSKARAFSPSEADGDVVISIDDARRTCAPGGVGLAGSEMSDILARDPGARAARQAAAGGARPGDAEAVGTVLDDDPDADPGEPSAISVAEQAVAKGDDGRADPPRAPTRAKASRLPVTARFAASDLIAGADDAAQAGTVIFAPGETATTGGRRGPAT